MIKPVLKMNSDKITAEGIETQVQAVIRNNYYIMGFDFADLGG